MWKMNMYVWSESILRKEIVLLRMRENRARERDRRKNLFRCSVPRMPAICWRESRNQGSRQDQVRTREAKINAGRIFREKTGEMQGA